jgi:BirA family biotin operon repressor/biotin-[acetyl-CoA-carboxylase] ligase
MLMKHYHFSEIGSTNDWAKENIAQCAKTEVTLITADSQTAGRGRYERKWISPAKSNLLASYVFFLKDEQFDRTRYVQLLALAAQELLRNASIESKIKWPNDLLVGNSKIAGILCETHPQDGGVYVIMGIGLNVNMKQEELAAIDQPATSMLYETGKIYDLSQVTHQLSAIFAKRLHQP